MIGLNTKSLNLNDQITDKIEDPYNGIPLDSYHNDQVLNESALFTKTLDLFSNEQPKILTAILFFDDYLYSNKVSLNISLRLQSFFINVLSLDDVPIQISEPSLRIIASISSSFSDKFDYLTFFSRIWKFLPSSNAFDAISSLVISSITAATTISNPPFISLIQKQFQSDDIKMKSGALGIFKSIAFHSELTSDLIEIFGPVLDFHQLAEPLIKIQCFETFTILISNHFWCNLFCNNTNLPIIFQIDQTNYFDAQLLSALQFLNELILHSDINPEMLILNADAIPMIMNGFTNSNSIIQIQSAYIIENVLKKMKYVPEFIWSCKIPQFIIDKNTDNMDNGSFKIYQFYIHSLCMICEKEKKDERVKDLIDLGIISIICDNIDLIDQQLINDAFLAMIKIMATSVTLNIPQVNLEISNNENFINFVYENDSELAIIILKLISKMEMQD